MYSSMGLSKTQAVQSKLAAITTTNPLVIHTGGITRRRPDGGVLKSSEQSVDRFRPDLFSEF
jgi:hypothetical protein